MVTVTICVPAFRSDTIGAAVRSLGAQTRPAHEVIVVGQGDADAVRAAVEPEIERNPRVRFLHIPDQGTCRARNAAFSVAEGDVLALIDDDCEASPRLVEVIADIFESEPRVGAVGGAVLAPPPLRRWPRRCPSLRPAEAVYDPAADDRPPPGWNWMGCNFAIRRHVAAGVGGFDEFLGPGTEFPSCEDVDYKLRLESRGVVVRSTARAVVWHASGWRYGWHAVLEHQVSYARGGGGLAGKLTLLGDDRGREWLEGTRAQYSKEVRRNPVRLLPAIRGYRHYSRAYHECVADYRVDARGLLVGPAAPSVPALRSV